MKHEDTVVTQHSAGIDEVTENVLYLDMQLYVVTEDKVDTVRRYPGEIDAIERAVADVGVHPSFGEARSRVLDHLRRDVSADERPALWGQPLTEFAATATQFKHVDTWTEIPCDMFDDEIGKGRATPFLAECGETKI
jgi:hypothetical protein